MLAVLSNAGTVVAASDESSAGDSYGRGVHAYFTGDSAAAEQLFAQAIGEDPHDPRPFYFRALCLLRQGRRDAALSDVMIGAALEARSPGTYPVGKALERVQGGDRLLLEQYRWRVQAARVIAEGAEARTANRADVAIHTDVGALRQKVSVPLERLVQPVSLAELVNVSAETPAPAAATTPVAAPESAAVVAPVATPIESTDRDTASGDEASPDDPFADDSRSAPGGKIPSGKLLGILGRAITESAPIPSLEGLRKQIPQLPLPAANGDAAAADDPFGANAPSGADESAGSEESFDPAADDPFSEPAPSAESSENSPAETSPVENSEPAPESAADEDPFG